MVREGQRLSFYTENLLKVPAHRNRNPIATFDIVSAIGPDLQVYMSDRYDDAEKVEEVFHRFPMAMFSRLSLDQICKVRFSTIYMMDRSVEAAFEKDPRLTIVNKIRSSMWRWGMRRSGWNETVDAYNGLRNFSFHQDFEVRLDHTTHVNECGYSEYSRTYLDGVFAYLIYYRGEHVMTIGFSFTTSHQLLIQQVQLKSRRGNRWLFKLPKNYLEYIIGQFHESFPRHRLFIIDGGDVAKKSRDAYRYGLDRAEKCIAMAKRGIEKNDDSLPHHIDALASARTEAAAMEERLQHMGTEIKRLKAFYANTGRYGQGREFSVNRLRHYALT